jgi:enoyl-CoA hydratase/carnithine racemase
MSSRSNLTACGTRWQKPPFESGAAAERWITTEFIADNDRRTGEKPKIDAIFGLPSVAAMLSALEGAAEPSDWTRATAKALRHRSPLMLHVVLEQVRRARHLGLADDLRMERSLVRHCFHLRSGTASETVEGIRALAVDKDHKPLWNPSTAELVTPEMVQAFFEPAWPAHANPLRHLN